VTGGSWTIVVPVKPTAIGKSRLSVDGVSREALARAIALDTIEAASRADGVGEVIVVTGDEELDAAASALSGVRVVGEGAARGLDAAVAVGAASAPGARAALLGDVPALRPADLAAALLLAGAVDHGVVADAEGTGSTLVTAAAGMPWASAFGEGSFTRHVGLGFSALAVAEDSTLRRDVDTAAHLTDAARLGLGSRTARLLAPR
jgi:2-phospho-L-lactate/phosphoenolpyruvate guanylyltransferase